MPMLLSDAEHIAPPETPKMLPAKLQFGVATSAYKIAGRGQDNRHAGSCGFHNKESSEESECESVGCFHKVVVAKEYVASRLK